MRNAFNIFVGKLEGKRPFGRKRRRWENNIGINVTEMVWEGVKSGRMDQNRDNWRALANTVLNFHVP
jgi:hypothetical protein